MHKNQYVSNVALKISFCKNIQTQWKEKIVFADYKTCKFVAKTVKSTQVTRFQKKKKNSPDFKE